MENELKRASDKVALLEEKDVTIKDDFKKKEAEAQIEQDKKLSTINDKVKELRKNIQNKEDELSNTKVQLKDAKENIKIMNNDLDVLSKKHDDLEKELTKKNKQV